MSIFEGRSNFGPKSRKPRTSNFQPFASFLGPKWIKMTRRGWFFAIPKHKTADWGENSRVFWQWVVFGQNRENWWNFGTANLEPFWVPKGPKWIDTSMLCLKEGEHVPLMYQNRISRSLTHSHGHVPKPPKNGFHENLERPIFSHFHPFWGQTGSKWRDRMFFRSN